MQSGTKEHELQKATVFAIVLCKTFSEDMWKTDFQLKGVKEYLTVSNVCISDYGHISTDIHRCVHDARTNNHTIAERSCV